jgi:hypothetical protein
MSFDDAHKVLHFLSERVGETVGRRVIAQSGFSEIFHLQAHPSHDGPTMYTVISGNDPDRRRTIRLKSDGAGNFEFL